MYMYMYACIRICMLKKRLSSCTLPWPASWNKSDAEKATSAHFDTCGILSQIKCAVWARAATTSVQLVLRVGPHDANNHRVSLQPVARQVVSISTLNTEPVYYNCTRETHKLLSPPLLNPPFVNSRLFFRLHPISSMTPNPAAGQVLLRP